MRFHYIAGARRACFSSIAAAGIAAIQKAAETGAASSQASAEILGSKTRTLRADVGKFLANIRSA